MPSFCSFNFGPLAFSWTVRITFTYLANLDLKKWQILYFFKQVPMNYRRLAKKRGGRSPPPPFPLSLSLMQMGETEFKKSVERRSKKRRGNSSERKAGKFSFWEGGYVPDKSPYLFHDGIYQGGGGGRVGLKLDTISPSPSKKRAGYKAHKNVLFDLPLLFPLLPHTAGDIQASLHIIHNSSYPDNTTEMGGGRKGKPLLHDSPTQKNRSWMWNIPCPPSSTFYPFPESYFLWAMGNFLWSGDSPPIFFLLLLLKSLVLPCSIPKFFFWTLTFQHTYLYLKTMILPLFNPFLW